MSKSLSLLYFPQYPYGAQYTGTYRDDYLSKAQTMFGLQGDDVIVGGPGDEYLYGGDDNDALVGEAYNYDYSGFPTLNGNDHLFGGNGDDRLSGRHGNDILFGGSGNDTLYGGAGRDFLFGGSGINVLYGGAGRNEYFGGEGRDYFYGGYKSGPDIVNYGKSTTSIAINMDDQTLNAGAAAGDILNRINVILGTRFDDTITGLNMRINGRGGDDILQDSIGRERLTGGAGNDIFRLVGDDQKLDRISDFHFGEDIIDLSNWGVTRFDLLNISVRTNGQGEAQSDLIIQFQNERLRLDGLKGTDISSFSASDFIFSDVLSDGTVQGTSGDDLIGVGYSDGGETVRAIGSTIDGLAGADTINTKNGNDIIYGGSGNDRILSGYGKDTLYGGDGNDRLISKGVLGGFGSKAVVRTDDVLFGGAGNDYIKGGRKGISHLYGGDGNDRLEGGGIGIAGDGRYHGSQLYGGNGRDSLFASETPVEIYGGSGNDTLHFKSPYNRGFSYQGVNVDMRLTSETVHLTKFSHHQGYVIDSIERIYLTQSNDTIYAHDTVVYAGEGDDIIFAENATVYGGTGNDVIHDGDGYEVLYDRHGKNTFVFVADDNQTDRIGDFRIGDSGNNRSVIDLHLWGVTSFYDLDIYERTNGNGDPMGDLIIQYGDERIRLDGLVTADIALFTQNHFVFATPEVV